jgi:hypothetical protein
LQIYCDESGGVGRGVMTLAAIAIDPAAAQTMLLTYRAATGLRGELKGSRIDMPERAALFDLIAAAHAPVIVSIAISAVKPAKGEDRGAHDISIYARLMSDAVGALLSGTGECTAVVMDVGRYDETILARVRSDIAALIGPWNSVKMTESHRAAGLQIADVIANSFFNRAFVTPRQPQLAHIVQPFLDSGQIKLRLLPGDAQRDNQDGEQS